MAQCHAGAPNTFLTLTYRARSTVTPNQAAKELARAWRLLRLRIMRKLGVRKLPFAAVVEATQAGWPHLHILMRSIFIDQRWLSQQMQQLVASPVVHIRRIDQHGRVAAYVAKYCGKATHKFGTAKRYWFSRDYELGEPIAKKSVLDRWTPWVQELTSLERYVERMLELGWRVSQRSRVKVYLVRPP